MVKGSEFIAEDTANFRFLDDVSNVFQTSVLDS